MSKDHNTVTCTHGKGLACPVCYVQSEPQQGTSRVVFITDEHTVVFDSLSEHPDVRAAAKKLIDSLSECSPACNCMKCNPTKSSCIALRASELNLSHVDVSGSDLPRVERFGDLPDGTLFYLAQTYAYGGRKKLIKTLEDGGPHNAVYNEYGGIGIQLRNEQLVFRA